MSNQQRFGASSAVIYKGTPKTTEPSLESKPAPAIAEKEQEPERKPVNKTVKKNKPEVQPEESSNKSSSLNILSEETQK